MKACRMPWTKKIMTTLVRKGLEFLFQTIMRKHRKIKQLLHFSNWCKRHVTCPKLSSRRSPDLQMTLAAGSPIPLLGGAIEFISFTSLPVFPWSQHLSTFLWPSSWSTLPPVFLLQPVRPFRFLSLSPSVAPLTLLTPGSSRLLLHVRHFLSQGFCSCCCLCR